MEITNNTSFKKIYLITDNASANTDYPVIEIYVNQTIAYTLVVGGSANINGISYTTTTGADNLNFASTVTTVGTQYIHEISVDTLTTSSDIVLEDGVWSFKVIGVTGSTLFYIGTIIHDVIDQCIMEHLDVLCTPNCAITHTLEEVNKIYALLYSAKISAKKSEFENAQCKYNIASTFCSDCNV
jgi:hypothetical protein